MKLHRRFLPALCAAAIAAAPAHADQEASNVPHVATATYGRCFAHSIPAEAYGTEGVTDIYAVGEALRKVDSFDWYSGSLYIACNVQEDRGVVAPAVVRFGPWARGHHPNDYDLAIAFYFNGKEVAWRSTLNIADGDADNAVCSVSHYSVIQEIKGFSYDSKSFAIVTSDGRELTFDTRDGRILKAVKSDQADEFQGNCPALGGVEGETK